MPKAIAAQLRGFYKVWVNTRLVIAALFQRVISGFEADVVLAEKGYLSNNLTFVEKRSFKLAF